MSELQSHRQDGDIVITDRGIGSYVYAAMLNARGVHSVCRLHQGRTISYPASSGPREKHADDRHRRSTPILMERLGDHDQVVELVKPHNRPKWMTPEDFAKIPATMAVRVLRFKISQPGFRTQEIQIVTTLLDSVKYPAADFAELYMIRWQVEANLRHSKQTLGMTSLHSKTVDGVTKGLLITVELPRNPSRLDSACGVMPLYTPPHDHAKEARSTRSRTSRRVQTRQDQRAAR